MSAGGATTLTDKACLAVPAVAALSVSVTVKAEVAAASGAPEITPVFASKTTPFGSAPVVTAHVYGGIPPFAPSVCEYCAPTIPSGSDPVVIPSGPPADTVSVNGFETEPFALSVSVIVKLNDAADVGVPVT